MQKKYKKLHWGGSLHAKRGWLVCPLRNGGGIFFICKSVCVVRSIYFDPLAWELPNLVKWLPFESKCAQWIFSTWSKVLVKLLVRCTDVVLSVSLDKSAWKLPNMVQYLPLEWWFQVGRSRSSLCHVSISYVPDFTKLLSMILEKYSIWSKR